MRSTAGPERGLGPETRTLSPSPRDLSCLNGSLSPARSRTSRTSSLLARGCREVPATVQGSGEGGRPGLGRRLKKDARPRGLFLNRAAHWLTAAAAGTVQVPETPARYHRIAS